jgi:hypothetical protein
VTTKRAARTQRKSAIRAPKSAPINVLGNAKHAKRLAALAAQEGASSLPLLEEAFTKGSKPMRAAAAHALAVVDNARGEALARDALDRVLAQKRPQQRDVKARVRDLVVQRTPFAIERALEIALERGIAVVSLDDDAQRILVTALVERVGARSLDDAAAFFEATLDIASARAFLVGVLDDEKRPPRDRREAAAALAALGDEPSLNALLTRARDHAGVVFDLALRVLLRIDAAAAYEKLAPLFNDDERARATIADEIGSVARGRADRRWRSLALTMLDLDARHALLLLAHVGAIDDVLAVAKRDALDTSVRHALHALAAVHDRRAVPVLLAWLTRPEGETHAPTLLAALAECAALDDIPLIEALPVEPDRIDFYSACIDRVRARASSITSPPVPA